MEDLIIQELKNLKRTVTPSEFFGKLFYSRNSMHLSHLTSQSYSEHIALNEYYEGLLDLIDDIIECYQGINGIVNISIPASVKEEPIKHLTDLLKFIDDNKKIFSDSAILNQIDEIKSLIQKTLYKLKNLK